LFASSSLSHLTLSILPLSPSLAMLRLLALVSLLLLTLSQSPVRASPCVSFDVSWNLLAFGFQGKDWNAGQQDSWTTSQSSFNHPPALTETSNSTLLTTFVSPCSHRFDRHHYHWPSVSIPLLSIHIKDAQTNLYDSPFDGANTTCYLAQFFNAIYVLNGDAKNPNSVSIYDAGAKSWSTQATTPGTFDYSSFTAILDHDTNFFCG
jgi:hypothetical protein